MLRELIDKFYLEREREKKERERVQFYISEVGKCPRSIFFKFKKAPAKEIEAERLRIFDHGDFIHRMILNPLFSFGIVTASEISIPPQEIIAGRADAIVSLNGEQYVLDVKSISGKMNFEKMEKPMPEHFWQVQLYLHYFRIKKGILLYVNKDTQELKEFVFDYQEEVVKELLEWFQKLKKKIESNRVPQRIPDYPDNWQCKSCQFREICEIVGEGEMDWENFKKKMETAEFALQKRG
jgi:CRISPR/Cas system-associated exonuclease Cas4 (RecB family)